MTIRIITAAFLAIIVFAGAQTECEAQEKGVLGVGLVLGEPTGVSVKFFLNDETALSAALGFAPLGNGLGGHVDYLWHPLVLEARSSVVLPLYVGLGGRVQNRRAVSGVPNHFRIGARAVAGVAFDFVEKPIDAFIEGALIFDARTRGDSFGFDVNFGAGVRYYF